MAYRISVLSLDELGKAGVRLWPGGFSYLVIIILVYCRIQLKRPSSCSGYPIEPFRLPTIAFTSKGIGVSANSNSKRLARVATTLSISMFAMLFTYASSRTIAKQYIIQLHAFPASCQISLTFVLLSQPPLWFEFVRINAKDGLSTTESC